MSTDEAISFLSETPFGTVWSWVALIAVIIVSAATCIIKLYKAFSFYKEKIILVKLNYLQEICFMMIYFLIF